MMSVAAYKVVHIFGVLLVFVALGATLAEGSRRRLASMTHGIGLLIVLIAGFGALARLGIHSPGNWPLWIWLKLVIWLVLGAAMIFAKRSPAAARALWWLLPLLGAAAAYLALFKPGA
jgi:hypothetical protein